MDHHACDVVLLHHLVAIGASHISPFRAGANDQLFPIA